MCRPDGCGSDTKGRGTWAYEVVPALTGDRRGFKGCGSACRGLGACGDYLFICLFFFQAEDGIRDRDVTGVQTCALPIYEAFQVSASFLPGHATIGRKINDLLIKRISLDGSAVFEPRSVFIVPLIESLRLPSDVSGKANPKSTTGRLDIFTRLITDTATEFESVPKG